MGHVAQAGSVRKNTVSSHVLSKVTAPEIRFDCVDTVNRRVQNSTVLLHYPSLCYVHFSQHYVLHLCEVSSPIH